MDREKYMSAEEVRLLRTVTQAQAVIDLKAGRVGGVVRWMVVDLALSTGLRVSEIGVLCVEHVDLKRGCLSVTRVKKRKRATETLAIGKELVEHLREYLAWRSDRLKDLHGAVQTATPTRGPLLIGKRGPLTAQGLQRAWKRAIVLSGLPKELSIHSTRHTLAVHLLRRTRNLRQVQKQLGHSSPAVTANMYADISFEDMQDGLNGIYGTA